MLTLIQASRRSSLSALMAAQTSKSRRAGKATSERRSSGVVIVSAAEYLPRQVKMSD